MDRSMGQNSRQQDEELFSKRIRRIYDRIPAFNIGPTEEMVPLATSLIRTSYVMIIRHDQNRKEVNDRAW